LGVIMASGQENSEEYGGPEWRWWETVVILAVGAAIIAAAFAWPFHYAPAVAN
jgi:hypothetical protein